jgi:hypothetical protein
VTYVPQNKTVFTAAYSGALAGIGASQKTPTDPNPTDPTNVGISELAGAWAEELDTLWGGVVPNELQVFSIEECSAAVFIGSSPPAEPPFTVPSNWKSSCAAIIAIVIAGSNFFASQGITPDPWPSESGANVVPSTFVWQPGGVASGNVYTSWTALMAAVAGSPGTKFITLDPSGAGFTSFTVDPGTWNLDQVHLTVANDGTANTLRSLVFPDNAFFTAKTLFCDSGVLLASSNTVGPVCTVASGVVLWETIAGGTNVTNVSAKPIFEVQSGATLNARLLANAEIFGSAPAIQADVGGTAILRFTSGIGTALSLEPSMLTGGGTFDIILDASTQFSTTQPGATGTVTYTWAPTINQVQSTTMVGSGTHTVSATTGGILRQKSGIIRTSGYCSGATAAADTITCNLVRDIAGSATIIATQVVTTTAGQLNYNVCFSPIIDTLPDNAAHTYSIRLVGSQNNTIPAFGAIASAIEL